MTSETGIFPDERSLTDALRSPLSAVRGLETTLAGGLDRSANPLSSGFDSEVVTRRCTRFVARSSDLVASPTVVHGELYRENLVVAGGG